MEVGWAILCLVILSLLIFLDAIRRMLKVKIKNTAISTQAVIVCSVAFLSEFCFMIPNLKAGFKNSPNWVFYVQTVGLVFGTTLLSFLLFRISVSMAYTKQAEDEFDDDEECFNGNGFIHSINDPD